MNHIHSKHSKQFFYYRHICAQGFGIESLGGIVYPLSKGEVRGQVHQKKFVQIGAQTESFKVFISQLLQ